MARNKAEVVIVCCVDAKNQPRLAEGREYTVVADVQSATTKDGMNKTGYILREKGATAAMPYLFRKSRFVIVPRT